MDTQTTLKQPTRSGKLLVGLPHVRMKKMAKSAACDGCCLHAKKCTRCLNKRAKQAVDRSARLQKRNCSKQTEGGGVAQTHLHETEAEKTNQSVSDDEEEDEELFADWAPGRIRASPERLLFTPTPPLDD